MTRAPGRGLVLELKVERDDLDARLRLIEERLHSLRLRLREVRAVLMEAEDA